MQQFKTGLTLELRPNVMYMSRVVHRPGLTIFNKPAQAYAQACAQYFRWHAGCALPDKNFSVCD